MRSLLPPAWTGRCRGRASFGAGRTLNMLVKILSWPFPWEGGEKFLSMQLSSWGMCSTALHIFGERLPGIWHNLSWEKSFFQFEVYVCFNAIEAVLIILYWVSALNSWLEVWDTNMPKPDCQTWSNCCFCAIWQTLWSAVMAHVVSRGRPLALHFLFYNLTSYPKKCAGPS